jgi:hypothetical protein
MWSDVADDLSHLSTSSLHSTPDIGVDLANSILTYSVWVTVCLFSSGEINAFLEFYPLAIISFGQERASRNSTVIYQCHPAPCGVVRKFYVCKGYNEPWMWHTATRSESLPSDNFSLNGDT